MCFTINKMAFFQLVLKANKLKRARQRYHEEKLRSIEISRGEKPRYTIFQKIRHKRLLLKRKLKKFVRLLICCPENSWIYQKLVLLKTEGSLENYVLKSIFGFLSGIVLTYIFFIFFVFQLHFSLISATFICSIFGVILTIGLAFFPYVRCIVFLFLPQFFSKRGRQALMAYAFILTLAGPAKNILHNLGVLSESLSCVQEQLKDAIKSVIDMIKHPFYALRKSITQIVKSIKAIVKKIKQMLIAIKRLVLSILHVIESAFEWLGSIVKICNKDFGTPYDRCNGMFESAVEDCKRRLGNTAGKICVITNIVKTVCMPLKPLDAICGLVSYVSNAIVEKVKEKLRIFTRDMKAMFFVKIKFLHYYHMETNKSRSLGDISAEVSSEIKARTRQYFGIFSWVGFLTSFFFIFLFLRVVYYRYKWLTSDRYDNHFLTSYMREIDIKRSRQDKETVFPLNWRERNKYISPTSIILAKFERVKLAKSAVFLTMTCVKLAIYMGIDYCLYWTLDNIRFHGKNQPREQQRQTYAASVQVKGNGFLADLYRSIAKAFSPYNHNKTDDLDAMVCLPDPKPPNYDSYFQIAVLALFCWIMALFEPYGLRLRHVVLCQYYPDRAKQRAVWLYNNILRSRGSFLKFARRQLRRKFGTAHNDGIERITVRERLWAVFPFLNKLAPLKLKNACVLCSQPERNVTLPHIKCPTPNCIGVYCPQCFQDLNKMCTICMSPMDYGDLSDISEEKDSSEEEVDLSHLKNKLEEILRTKYTKNQEISEDVKKKVEAVTDVSDDEFSKYSYSYQDELETEPLRSPQRPPFKDVEAQPIHDHVTVEIFSESLCEVVSSSSGSQAFCFGLNKKRKRKKQSIDKDEKSESTSIADTEFWSTEEVADDDEEDVLDIEIEDFDEQKHSHDELLPNEYKRKTKHKKSRIKKLLLSFRKIFSFKKKKGKRVQQFKMENCIDCNYTCNTTENSSSSILSTCDENHDLLSLQNFGDTNKLMLRKRNNRAGKILDSDKISCFTNKTYSKEILNKDKYRHPYEIKFEANKLRRHLQSIYNNTKYYEIDESSSYVSPLERIQYKADYSTLTDTRSSVDSDLSHERRSSTSDVDNDSYIYTSKNRKRYYKTRSLSSDSISTEYFEFSEMSNDFLDVNQQLCHDNDEALNKQIKSLDKYREDKINENSDENGSKDKKRLVYRSKKYYDSASDANVYIIKGSRKSNDKIKNEIVKSQIEKNSEESSKTIVSKSDRIKFLKKVEKETANIKKRNSVMNEKSCNGDDDGKVVQKFDKLVSVQETDIKESMKQNKGKFFKKSYVTKAYDVESNDKSIMDEKSGCEAKTGIVDQTLTRDQGTYVRLKTNKVMKSENEKNSNII